MEILNELTKIGVDINSESAVTVAKWYFAQEMVRLGALTIIFSLMVTFTFLCVRKVMIHEGIWK